MTRPTLPETAEVRALRAADGTALTALAYRPTGAPKGRIVVAGATGVPQRFYRAFADYAATRGHEVHTLDYRGIGLSKPKSLRGYRMDYLDWVEQDLPALLSSLPDDGVPLHLVGHSFGGHAYGLLPDPNRFKQAWICATGAGWAGWMPPLEAVRVRLLWNVVAPVWTRMYGYLAWSRFGMGEDLPYGVYRDWKRWCSYPRYFFDDPEMAARVTERFDRVRTPITAVNALDDTWAPPRSRDAFMAGYRNAPLTPIDLDPQAHGLKGIGHMGYFRRGAEPLWDQALASFEAA
ncbi:MAG: alpha/beta fold hydrolase [Xanthomonadales bacterium]|jgi:predicted alpha/beta hydrolase|nr:alpha/beta fold hydrolase [Xanthomonadales bacterium]